MLQLTTKRLDFPTGGGQQGASVTFNNDVRSAEACIKSFRTYDETHLQMHNFLIEIKNVRAVDTRVDFDVEFRYNDNDGRTGMLELVVLVIADVEAAS